MTVDGPGPRPRGRDNGLHAATYAPVADLDPRIAESLLQTLAERGIAAYVTPTPSTAGPNLERRPPANLTDRLWVDVQAQESARELVAAETGEAPAAGSTDDDAWAQIVASLTAADPETERVWPAAEEATSLSEPVPFRTWSPAEEPEEHFVPPPPPPLPRIAPATLSALLAMLGGVLLLLLPNITGESLGSFLTVVAVLAILAGFGSLIWRMHDGPPTDSGPDDGAIV